MERKKRKFSSGFLMILALFFLLTSCNKETAEGVSQYLGPVNYQADVAYLEWENTAEGEFLEYREVKDLEGFLTFSDRPIVLAIRQEHDRANPVLIPLMEEWAVKYKDSVYFIFADLEADDEILLNFETPVTPTIHLIAKNAKIMYMAWGETGGIARLEEAIEARIAK